MLLARLGHRCVAALTIALITMYSFLAQDLSVLFLACELALAKCSVLILESGENPHSPLKRLPFGLRGLSAPSVEALDRRQGLLNELELHKRIKNRSPKLPDKGHVVSVRMRTSPAFHFNEGSIRVDPSQWRYRLPSSTDTSLISEMAELESVLARRAEALGVKIRARACLDFFSSNGGRSHCSVRGDNLLRVNGSWGAMEAAVLFSKTGGFEFAGTEPEFTGNSTQIEITESGET